MRTSVSMLDGPAIVGLTAIGHATARLLKMNDGLRLTLRAELIALGDLTIEATDSFPSPKAPKEQNHETER